MTLAAQDLEDLTRTLADRLYLQVASWHLYLGDAGLAEALAIECAGRLDQGAAVCARQALEGVQDGAAADARARGPARGPAGL